MEIEHRTEELNPEDEVVGYCHVGQRSAAVAEYLAQLGFKNAKHRLGGLDYGAQSEGEEQQPHRGLAGGEATDKFLTNRRIGQSSDRLFAERC